VSFDLLTVCAKIIDDVILTKGYRPVLLYSAHIQYEILIETVSWHSINLEWSQFGSGHDPDDLTISTSFACGYYIDCFS